jgi:hypothetical protein
MKWAVSLLLFVQGEVLVRGGDSSQTNGTYLPSSVEIVWSAPTNQWPQALWVYKVEPQEFPPAVISNLLALANFTIKDRAKSAPGHPPIKDPKAFYFRNSDESRRLGIFPSLGWIEYHDGGALAPMDKPIRNVPSEEEIRPLALNFVRLLGIDRSLLETKLDSPELDAYGLRGTRRHMDQGSGKLVTEINYRGIFFVRRIDGIPIGGIGLNGGLQITFANSAKVMDLQVSWRNLKPFELHQCASPEEIVQWLKSGRIALPASVGSAWRIRTITIQKAVPLYDGKYGDEPQDFVSPYLGIEAVVNSGSNSIPVQFKAPIFLTGNKPAVTGRNLIPKEGLDVLENGQVFTLLSLDPEPGTKATNTFHGFRILGDVQIKNESERHAILDALYAGMALEGPEAMCFNPRHGIHVKMGNRVEDLVICFECGQIYFYGASEGKLVINGTPTAVLNRILSAARVPISK